MEEKKNIVVTGGNRGVGLETVKALYEDGHNIIFGSRSERDNEDAIKFILAEAPQSTGSVKCFQLDLSQKASIEEFSRQVKEQFNVIDMLINNAGILMFQRVLSEMGVEMTMAVNYFGHFYLTYLLLPCLKISKEARIINVSSRSYMLDHWSSCADLKCEEGFDTMVQLKKSKVAVVQFNFGLAEKLKKYPHIKTMSLDPGIHCEPLNARIGATTSLYLARLQFSQLQSGQFYRSNTLMKVLKIDMEEVNTQWAISEEVCGIQFSV